MAINWGELIKVAGPVASGMANAMTQNRSEQNATNIVTARDAERAALDRADLGLREQQEARAAEAARIRQALAASLMMNMKDVSFDRSKFKTAVPDVSFSGGARPSAIGAQGDALAQLLYSRAMTDLQSPTGGAQPHASASGVPAYQPPDVKGSSLGEKILGGVGLGATMWDKLAPALGLGSKATGTGSYVADAVRGTEQSIGSGAASAANGGRSVLGAANSLAGPASLVAGLAAPFLPAGSARDAASYGAMGAQIGSFVPGIGTAIGGGVGAIVGAIKGHQNETKGQREDLAKALGYGTLDRLYQALDAAGPEGQRLRDIGLNVIGRHDDAAQKQWNQQVAALLGGRR